MAASAGFQAHVFDKLLGYPMPKQPTLAIEATHGIVYRNDSEFNSHPFLGGFWRTGDGSLLLAFMSADCNYENPSDVHHDNITTRRRRMRTIRSFDSGVTWDAGAIGTVFETPEQPGDAVAEAGQTPLSEANDADVLIATGSSPAILVPDAKTWMRISTDGGRSWRPSTKLPMFKLASLSGHGSVTRRQDGLWLAALTACSQDGWTRRPVFYGSWDGLTWTFLSFITPANQDNEVDAPNVTNPRFGAHRYMYPRPIPLRDGRLLISVRSQRDPTSALWTEIYESHDGGRTSRFLSRVNDWGAPGDVVQMADGRIVCVYGYRLAPYGIRYRVSHDGGKSWGDEVILRTDGGSWDLGYPRVIEHSPGRLLAVYYFNSATDKVQFNGGVRHIASTEFAPQ